MNNNVGAQEITKKLKYIELLEKRLIQRDCYLKGLKQENNSKENTIEQLQQKHKEDRKHITFLENQVNEKNGYIDKLKQETNSKKNFIEQLQQKNVDVNKRTEQLEGEKIDYQRTIDEKKKKLDEYQAELEVLIKIFSDKDTSWLSNTLDYSPFWYNSKKKHSDDAISDQIQQIHGILRTFENNLKLYKETIEKKQLDIDCLQDAIGNYNTIMRENQSTIEDLKKDIIKNRKKTDNLRSTVEAKTAMQNKLLAESENKLKLATETLEHREETYKNNIGKLSYTVMSLENELKQHKNSLKYNEKLLDANNKKLEDATAEMCNLKNSLDNLNKLKTRLEKENLNLSRDLEDKKQLLEASIERNVILKANNADISMKLKDQQNNTNFDICNGLEKKEQLLNAANCLKVDFEKLVSEQKHFIENLQKETQKNKQNIKELENEKIKLQELMERFRKDEQNVKNKLDEFLSNLVDSKSPFTKKMYALFHESQAQSYENEILNKIEQIQNSLKRFDQIYVAEIEEIKNLESAANLEKLEERFKKKTAAQQEILKEMDTEIGNIKSDLKSKEADYIKQIEELQQQVATSNNKYDQQVETNQDLKLNLEKECQKNKKLEQYLENLKNCIRKQTTELQISSSIFQDNLSKIARACKQHNALVTLAENAKNTEKYYITKVLAKIPSIENEVSNCVKQIDNFHETRESKTYIDIKEKLLKAKVKIYSESETKQELLLERRDVLKYIVQLLDDLDKKADTVQHNVTVKST